jgi:hypothetical protein
MGSQWRKFLVAAGIARVEGESPSPWFIGVAGSLAVMIGIGGVLFGTASDWWVFTILAIGGAIEVGYARRIHRAKGDGPRR